MISSEHGTLGRCIRLEDPVRVMATGQKDVGGSHMAHTLEVIYNWARHGFVLDRWLLREDDGAEFAYGSGSGIPNWIAALAAAYNPMPAPEPLEYERAALAVQITFEGHQTPVSVADLSLFPVPAGGRQVIIKSAWPITAQVSYTVDPDFHEWIVSAWSVQLRGTDNPGILEARGGPDDVPGWLEAVVDAERPTRI